MTFESLSRSAKRNGFDWVTCVNAALSDREGEMPFFTVSDGSAHSLVPEIDALGWKRLYRDGTATLLAR